MVPQLNNMLGVDICNYVSSGDVQIASVSALLATKGSNVSNSFLFFFQSFAFLCSCLQCAIQYNFKLFYAAKQNIKQPKLPSI